MAGAFTNVNLSQLPAPDAVEQVDYEVILAEMLADLRARDSTFDALVESDPAYKVLEVAAYRETHIRQRANEACKAVMLAFAVDGDLDHLGANKNLQRLVLVEEDLEAIPPVLQVLESNDDFRNRIQLSPEGYTTAGSEGSYVFHALSADGDVKDASADSPTPGVVDVYILSRTGNGTAGAGLIEIVEEALNAEFIRPMTDNVTVQSATIQEYAITAELTLYPGPDSAVVMAAAEAAVQAYVDSVARIGYDVTLSGIYHALHQVGVQNVGLTLPAADIVIDDSEASYCTAITITAAPTTNV